MQKSEHPTHTPRAWEQPSPCQILISQGAVGLILKEIRCSGKGQSLSEILSAY